MGELARSTEELNFANGYHVGVTRADSQLTSGRDCQEYLADRLFLLAEHQKAAEFEQISITRHANEIADTYRTRSK